MYNICLPLFVNKVLCYSSIKMLQFLRNLTIPDCSLEVLDLLEKPVSPVMESLQYKKQ